MAIAGVKFGGSCDHRLRVPVSLLIEDSQVYFKINTPASPKSDFILLVNDEPHPVAVLRLDPASSSSTKVQVFNVDYDSSLYPPDDYEVLYSVSPKYCTKCVLRDDATGEVVITEVESALTLQDGEAV